MLTGLVTLYGLGHFSATFYLQQTNTLSFQVYHGNYNASFILRGR